MSALHVDCPSCRAPAGLGCTTQSGEFTAFHAPREARGVVCPVCKATAGIACTGLPAGRPHHPERLYAARGQAGPGAQQELRRLLEGLWHFSEAHPEMVADLSLTVRVRSEAQVPPMFGERSKWFTRDQGRRYLSVGVAVGEAEPDPPPPRRPDPAPLRALPACADARPAPGLRLLPAPLPLRALPAPRHKGARR